MLFSLLGKTDHEKEKMLFAIGPTWGASEVWLITAGGAMFAAFPGWYATMFSGFYPALFLVLAALIARGTGIEFWHKASTEKTRKLSSALIFFGSLLTPLLLAVAFANLFQGIPIDENQNYTGGLFTLFSPFTLLVGVTTVAFFVYHGAVVLFLKTEGSIEGNDKMIQKFGLTSLVLLILTIAVSGFGVIRPVNVVFGFLAFILLLISYWISRRGTRITAFVLNCLVILLGAGSIFAGMFPNVIVSSTDLAYNLTIYNVSSSPYTLRIMTIVTCIALPVVILYTVWAHWVFWKLRVSAEGEADGEEGTVY